MKTLFGKKLINLTNGEFAARFKNKENLLNYWEVIKQNTDDHNFAEQPSNWAACCRDTTKKIYFKPEVELLYIKIIKETENLPDWVNDETVWILHLKKENPQEAWVIYGCSNLDEAEKFKSEDEGSLIMITEPERKALNISVDFGD
jgi:hypothetical protein